MRLKFIILTMAFLVETHYGFAAAHSTEVASGFESIGPSLSLSLVREHLPAEILRQTRGDFRKNIEINGIPCIFSVHINQSIGELDSRYSYLPVRSIEGYEGLSLEEVLDFIKKPLKFKYDLPPIPKSHYRYITSIYITREKDGKLVERPWKPGDTAEVCVYIDIIER